MDPNATVEMINDFDNMEDWPDLIEDLVGWKDGQGYKPLTPISLDVLNEMRNLEDQAVHQSAMELNIWINS